MSKKKFQIQGELPPVFLDRLKEMLSIKDQILVRKSFVKKPTTFRINTLKTDLQVAKKALLEAGFQFENQPWSDTAFILKNKSKEDLMLHPVYEKGEIYIQSLASQIPAVVMDIKPNMKILDLTAAPGSKTSQISALLNNTGLVVANDVNKVRFFKLKHNLEKLGVTNTKLTMLDGSHLASKEEYSSFFDRILLDAPCSAEARFVENNIKTLGFWSERKIKEMAKKQRKLLYSAYRCLKKGGSLIYSTCTLAPEENELMIAKFLQKNPDATLDQIEIDIKSYKIKSKFKNKEIPQTVIDRSLRIMPNNDIESFYIAKLTKTV